MVRFSSVAALVTATLALSACAASNAGMAADDATTAGTVTKAQSDIVDTAANAGSFKTLVAAVKAADLESTLRGPGPFTVFAPTDEAFAKLPAGTVESLLEPRNKDKLRSILTYHVVSGRVGSEQAAKLSRATTVSGKDISIDSSAGGVRIGKANVIKADIASSNGVIHVIDTVLVPE